MAADASKAGAAARDAPVRQRSLRTHNLGLVLRHVAASPRPVSRADVAAATGLTKATVSTLVDELLAGSLLAEVDPKPRTGAGRPAIGLRLASQGPAGLGLEVNVDYLAAAVVDLTGTVRHSELSPGEQRGRDPARVLVDVARLAADAVDSAAAQGIVVAGAALAVPGLVAEGTVRLAPNLGWRELDVRAALRQHSFLDGIALTVENEANLAAMGELHAQELGAADAPPYGADSSFLYISGEIGIGAGIVLDGQLFRGTRGYGGELGHVTIRPDGPHCRCGARGCLEAYANQEALLRHAALDTEPSGEAIGRLAALARASAPVALMALAEAGSALGVAAASVVNLLDVETVVLGGIYAPLAPWLIGPVSREISERVITAAWAPVTVRASALGSSATVLGAAGSVVRGIREAPANWLAAAT
jgi:predicted NBD/HSP70 family sugar kinase